MKFAFHRADFLAIGERNINPVKEFSIEDYKLIVFDKSIYYNSVEKRVVAEKSDAFYVFMEVEGCLCQIAVGMDLDRLIEQLHSAKDQIPSWIENKAEGIKDIEGYNRTMAQIKEERKADAIRREKEAEEREAKALADKQLEFKNGLENYKNGQMIDWETFEYWCGVFDINIPIKTLGSARKSLFGINRAGQLQFDRDSSIGKSRTLGRVHYEFNKKL